MVAIIADLDLFVKCSSLLGQEHGEVGHELRDVADEDAQDARHDLGVKRCGVMRDDDIGEDGGIGGEVELDEAAVLVLPHEPAREQHGVRVVDGVLRKTDADGRIGRAVDDDGDGQAPLLCRNLAFKDGGVAVVAQFADGKTGDVFLFDIFLECLGRFDHDQSPPSMLFLFVCKLIRIRMIGEPIPNGRGACVSIELAAECECDVRMVRAVLHGSDIDLKIVGDRIVVVAAVDVDAPGTVRRRLPDNDRTS